MILKENFVNPDISKFDLSIDQVARYSGGSKYTLDTKKAVLAKKMLDKAVSLALPAYTYEGFEVLHHEKGKAMQLAEAFIECPAFISSKVVGVVALISTIGPDLEKQVTALNKNNEFLDAFFLDAAGLAILEGVNNAAYKRITDKLGEQGFYPGCCWEPGCEKTSLTDQKILFDLVSPNSLGVTLSDSYVFLPYKTVSSWIPITNDPMGKTMTNKCQQCSLKNCLYRQNTRT
ncbi:hypothetical protein [Desulfobacula sp.]